VIRIIWLTTVFAVFMTVVVTSCILVAPEGFRLPYAVGITAGLTLAAVLFALFISLVAARQKDTLKEEPVEIQGG
jgi:hypothetical protein